MRLERASILGLTVLAMACTPKSKGGQKDDPVIVTVGSHTVTKAYFEDRLEKMDRSLLPDTLDLAGKHKFLDFIINKEVMALKAEELGYDEDKEVKATLTMLEEQLLHGKSVELAIQDKASVSDEEIQKFYTNMQRKVLVKQVLVPTRVDAEAVLKDLRAGANFDSMVDVHSQVPRVSSDGTDIPVQQRAMFADLKYGQANPAVEEAVFDTPLGQLSNPVETPYGWHVFMPVSESAEKAMPLADERERIEKQITGRKRRDATNDYYESILARRHFKIEPEAMAVIYDKMPVDEQSPVDPATEVKPIIDFTNAQRDITFFEIDGKKSTIGDFSDLYDQTPWPERPRKWVGAQGLYYWLRDGWLKPLQIEQARIDGVDKIPEVMNEIKLRHEMLMVGALHTYLIAQQVPDPTDADVRKFYDDHQTVYVEKEKRVCNLIFHPRERIVRRAHDEIVAGADFVEIAIRYNDNAVSAENVQTAAFGRDDDKHKELADSAFAKDVHAYTQPFKTSQGWIILQVQQIIPERPFALEDIQENVIQDWQNQWSENRLNELLVDWKKEYTVTVNDKVLAAAEVRRTDVFVPGKTDVKVTPGGTN